MLWTSRGAATEVKAARSRWRQQFSQPVPFNPMVRRPSEAGPQLRLDQHRTFTRPSARSSQIGKERRGRRPTIPRTGEHDGVAMAQNPGSTTPRLGAGFRQSVSSRTASATGCKTALQAGADGSLYAAWRHVYPGNLRDMAFTMSKDGGRSFTSVRVSEDGWAINGCPDDGPAIALDRRGDVLWRGQQCQWRQD